jgi:hypothetical protein
MKIGSLQFKEFAAAKPVTVAPDGKLMTLQDVAATPTLGFGSLFTLSEQDQLKLALKRYEMEPDFRLGIIGLGVLTKAEVMQHLKLRSEFGKVALSAEMGYCNELVAAVSQLAPAWPKTPIRPPAGWPDWKPVKKCVKLKLKNTVLFCENTTDGVTAPIAARRMATVHPAFVARGFTVVALTGSDDTRADFLPVAKRGLTVYVGGVGHGNYTLYTGHNGDRILEVGQYDAAEVNDKVLHFLSCRTAATLGPDTVAKGAKAYAGYNENFTFVWDNSATPVNEFLLFVDADSTFDLWMAAGKTAQEAYDATIQAFNAAAAQVPGTAAATWLTYDRDHCKRFGASDATVAPWRYVKLCFPIKKFEMEEALALHGEVAD